MHTIIANKYNLYINIFIYSAPGSYDIEKAEKSIKQSSGAVSFGIKYKEPKPNNIPGNF